mgnify:CR=1 FL=1
MPNILEYSDYYSRQMHFIDRYIRNDLTKDDDARIKRIKELESKQSIHFLDDFLAIENGKELETTRIGYKPLPSVNYPNEHHILAPSADKIKEKNRRLSRYRLIYGPVNFYLERQFEKPIEIPVITACAPNLMGTSTTDLNEFSVAGNNARRLKEDVYRKECQKLAEFIVGAAHKEGQQRLIMPAFGVGVYINKLDPHSKELATEIMYRAFADAAKKHQVSVDWIVWRGAKNYTATAQKLAGYSVGNPLMKPVVHDDMLLYAQELRKANEKVVLLNPGSDRTVGGLYTHEHPTTLDEQIAQQSDLVCLQTEFNQSMVRKFKVEFEQRKKIQNAPVVQKDPKVPLKINLKECALKIRSALGVQETPWISQDTTGNYKVSFKQQENAQKFSALLAANKIVGLNGTPKLVHNKEGYFVIYLIPKQLMQIPILTAKVQEKVPRKVNIHFFTPKSCLSKEQKKQIEELIATLNEELSGFCVLRGRKQGKVNALTMMLNQSQNYSSAEKLVKAVIAQYPDATKGIFSHRTDDLLKQIHDHEFSPKGMNI